MYEKHCFCFGNFAAMLPNFYVQLRRDDNTWRNHPMRLLPCISLPRFFAIDCMHALDLGIARDIGLLLLGTVCLYYVFVLIFALCYIINVNIIV